MFFARKSDMANARRGDVAVMIGGEPRVMRLTLGALAELETGFGVEDLTALGVRFAEGKLKSADLIALLGAGLRAGGLSVADRDVGGLDFDGGLHGAIAAVAQLLTLTFGVAEDASRPPD
jgi:Phage tail tube protein, GTA-gp10